MITERELLTQLRDELRRAILDCEALASLPARGPTYHRLHVSLRQIEELCRRVGYNRQDSRWFGLGLMMEQVHKRAGEWLRGHYPRPLFLKLADNMRKMERALDDVQTKATGRVGMILPKPQPLPHREARPVQVVTPGGIIVPA
jgi:hypothetical protein